MRLDVRAFAIAAAAAVGIGFTLCSVAFAAAPGATVDFARHALHVDLGPVSESVTAGGYVEGLLFVAAYAALLAGIAGWTFNRIARTDRPA